MQNLPNTPKATEAWGDSRQFSVQVRLASAGSARLDSGVKQLLQLMPDGPTKPTPNDLVMTVTISGLAFPDDRIRIAKSIGQLWDTGLQSLRRGTPRAQLISPMGMAQTVSTCSPTSSTTVLYWHTSNDAQRRAIAEMYVAAAAGAGVTMQGLPGFANAAFGPMPGPSMIDSAEGGEEPYDRVVDPTAAVQGADPNDRYGQVMNYLFKASGAATRRAAPSAKKARKAGA